jgi:uncharacterized protein YuzE
MKLTYYAETDSLYIDLSDWPSEDSVEISEDVVLDLDAAGHVVGIDIQHASERADLSSLDVKGLPTEIFPLTRARVDKQPAEAVTHSVAR